MEGIYCSIAFRITSGEDEDCYINITFVGYIVLRLGSGLGLGGRFWFKGFDARLPDCRQAGEHRNRPTKTLFQNISHFQNQKP